MRIYGVRANIAYHNLVSRLRVGGRPHVSGYRSGDSPETDILTAIDHAGNVVGHVSRKYAHAHGVIHATVHVLLFSPRGRILVQMRGHNKDSSPGKLSQSVGGHVALGYTPQETAVKESYEELGVRLADVQLVTTYPYESRNHDNQELVYLYQATHNGPVYPNYSEVAWAAFFGVKGIRALANQEPSRFAPSFQQDLRHL